METCDYNHLFLYAKSHYEVSQDIVDDVRTILAHRAAVDKKSISDGAILDCLLEVSNEHKLSHKILKKIFINCQVLNGCFSCMSLTRHGLTPYPNADLLYYVECVLVEMANIRVMNGKTQILDLGKPDPAVLPLRNKE